MQDAGPGDGGPDEDEEMASDEDEQTEVDKDKQTEVDDDEQEPDDPDTDEHARAKKRARGSDSGKHNVPACKTIPSKHV